MYVFQMNDGFWHISLMSGSRSLFDAILANHKAWELYYRWFDTEREARAAEASIRAILAGAAA